MLKEMEDTVKKVLSNLKTASTDKRIMLTGGEVFKNFKLEIMFMYECEPRKVPCNGVGVLNQHPYFSSLSKS